MIKSKFGNFISRMGNYIGGFCIGYGLGINHIPTIIVGAAIVIIADILIIQDNKSVN